jgi:hypothetical protein
MQLAIISTDSSPRQEAAQCLQLITQSIKLWINSLFFIPLNFQQYRKYKKEKDTL